MTVYAYACDGGHGPYRSDEHKLWGKCPKCDKRLKQVVIGFKALGFKK